MANINRYTVEPYHRDNEQCLIEVYLCRGDNYKDYMSVLSAGTRRVVPLMECHLSMNVFYY